MLSKGNIHLRKLEPRDIDLLYKWENDTDNWILSNTITPFSKYTLQEYIATAHDDIYATKQLRLIIESSNAPVGCIDLFDFDPINQKVGVGILIDKQSRETGFATKALELLVNYCFSTLNVHQVYCNILTDNTPSIKLFQNAGFEIVGTKKDWVRTQQGWQDEYLLQKLNA